MALSPYDQSIRDAGYKYIPQSQYLLDPFRVPAGSENEVPTGIATVPMSMGGGGGMGYTGGITDLTTGFQNTVDARTQRLEDAYDSPSKAKLFGMNMFKQDVNPADAGFYVGEGMRIPQERTALGKMFQPQSPQEIMEQGYEPRTNIGILSSILSKADKFGTLSRPDQAFITSQMGYTGPTVFGENTTGGSKDPFGLNTRSAFGNYAERVGKEADKLSGLLTETQAEKYGKNTSGITFNAATGMFEAIDDEDKKAQAAALKATQMNKMNIAKFNFYREKVKERDEFRRQEEERQAAIDAAALQRAQQEIADKGYQDYGQGGASASEMASYEGSDGSYAGASTEDYGGGEKDGGFIDGTNRRMDFMMGGLANLVDIYD